MTSRRQTNSFKTFMKSTNSKSIMSKTQVEEEEQRDEEIMERTFYGKFKMHVSDLIEAFSKNGVKEAIS